MIVKANAAGVLGTGHYVPDRVVTNTELESMSIHRMNGFRAVRVSKRGTLPKTE